MDKAGLEQAYAPAARQALAAFGIEPTELAFEHLSENVTFRVTDARDGAALVLRLHRPGYHDLAELKSEHVWTRALTAAGIAVPESRLTLASEDFARVEIAAMGETRWAGLAGWIEGELLDGVIAREPDAARGALHFERLGRIMAALHNQASGWATPPGFVRHALDEDGLMGAAPFWGEFWSHPVFSSIERALMLRLRDAVRAALVRYGKARGTYSLIHADLHSGNVLVQGERAAVIDFDDAGFGWHQYDLAVALLNYREHPHFEAFRAACIAGYRSIRPISDKALSLVPMFLMAREMVQIGWLHQRPELPPWSRLPQVKDRLCAAAEQFEAPC
jgi:Ser/Thr protein kinase RdoA (MazF antagonist)